jgi:hypothetical protein
MEQEKGVGWDRAPQDLTEDHIDFAMTSDTSPPVRWSGGYVRPRLIVLPSFLSLLVAGVVALGVWFDVGLIDFCNVARVNAGTNINHAVALVAIGGLAGAVVLPLVSVWRWPVAVLTFFGAGILAAGIALVALDSATYMARLTGTGFMGETCPRMWTRHLTYLYSLWGAPLLVLVIQFTRLVMGTRPAPPMPRPQYRAHRTVRR